MMPDTVYHCYYCDRGCNIQSAEGSLRWVNVLNAYSKVAIESVPEVSGANPPTFSEKAWVSCRNKQKLSLMNNYIFVCWPFSLAMNYITAKGFVPWLAYVYDIWLPGPSGSFVMSRPTRICYEKFLLTAETCFLTEEKKRYKNDNLTCGGAEKTNWVGSFKVWVKVTALYCIDRNT